RRRGSRSRVSSRYGVSFATTRIRFTEFLPAFGARSPSSRRERILFARARSLRRVEDVGAVRLPRAENRHLSASRAHRDPRRNERSDASLPKLRRRETSCRPKVRAQKVRCWRRSPPKALVPHICGDLPRPRSDPQEAPKDFHPNLGAKSVVSHTIAR